MKRSEMIKLIWDFVQKVECNYDCYMYEDDCEQLLTELEKAGMTPPQYVNPMAIEEGFIDPKWGYLEYLDKYSPTKYDRPLYSYYLNGWESEDGK